jgi:hypothetical protein
MNIAEEMAGMLNYLNGHNRPKVTSLRNIRRVKFSESPWPYSFIFEAEINGEWKTYEVHRRKERRRNLLAQRIRYVLRVV